MPAPKQILSLIDRFERNKDAYSSGAYNETQIRIEFIDPFFETLGWDIHNKQGYAEAYKDVIHEDAIRVEGSVRAPDYCFRIGGTRKFFLEAKKPSVSIKDSIHPAYQLRRYAWSAKLPLSVLTDFEEFAVYDCRLRPNNDDSASVARQMYLSFRDYATRWDELESVFSREAVLKGSFDRYAEDKKGKKGTAEVDDAFLSEIESWRDALARNIAIRNPSLSMQELNFAVQKTIDRVIFLRICEDRGIETQHPLRILLNGTNVYKRLVEIFYRADERYNSGLFHFQKEKDRSESPDGLTLGLDIDDKVLKDIIQNLYYPQSPYEFSVLPADILGQVYEQFLGKVIRLTAGHRAVVEDKPEVKKAGGVYYTPTYIVDYIVKNTVGRLLEGKTPREISGGAKDPLRVLDPACGSGSFLIVAYQYLLDWYRDRYAEQDTEKLSKGREPKLYQSQGGGWKLTTAERKRILLSHIYGVDIDPQAVEVTKLSLLLKVLEGETENTLTSQLKLFHERALPDLSNNIKCGNSLIGPDFYEHQQMSVLDDDERRRVNAFDWSAEFPEAMEVGGFDAVIGNPPYGAFLNTEDKNYLIEHYPDVSDFETSQFFIVKSKNITKQYGLISYIVPNTLFLNLYAKSFRLFISSNYCIINISNLSNINVFSNASVRTVIPIIKNELNSKNETYFLSWDNPGKISTVCKIKQSLLLNNDNMWIESFSDSKSSALKDKIWMNSIPLGDILNVSQGLIPYDKYRGHDENTIKNRIWHSDKKKDKTYKKELKGEDVKRYYIEWNQKQWISYGPWLAAPRKPDFFKKPRILIREITDIKQKIIHATFTEEEFYNNPGIINCISKGLPYSLFYVLGLVNSKLISYLHYSYSPKARKGLFPKILVNDVRNIPIRKIDFQNVNDKKMHDYIVSQVTELIQLKIQLSNKKTEPEKNVYQRQISVTDRKIDKLVYNLYELTDEEIRIVEGSTSAP